MNSSNFSTLNITTNITTTTTMNNTTNTMTTTTNNNQQRRHKKRKKKQKKPKNSHQSHWESLDVAIGLQDDTISTSTAHINTSRHTQHTSQNRMNNNWRSNTPSTSSYPYNTHNSHNQSVPQLKQHIGLLTCYKPEREFGFISCNDFKNDIFFHGTAFNFHYNPQQICNIIGDQVKFNVITYNDKHSGEEKQKAINIITIKINTTAIILNNNNNTSIKPSINTNETLNTPNFNWRDHGKTDISLTNYDHNNCPQLRAHRSPSATIAPKSRYHTGTLLFLDYTRGFGFISCDDDNHMNINDDKNHLFVHESEFKCNKSNIYKGMRVQFIIQHYNNGKRKAINVSIEINDTESIISDTLSIASISSIGSYTPKYRGILLFFNNDKKHGFIRCHSKDILNDVFVYESEFKFPKRYISNNINVRFDIDIYKNKQNQTAKRAVHVILDRIESIDTINNNNNSSERNTWRRRSSNDGFAAKYFNKDKQPQSLQQIDEIEEERHPNQDQKQEAQQSELQNADGLNKNAPVFTHQPQQVIKISLSTIHEVDEVVEEKKMEIEIPPSKVMKECVSKITLNIDKLFKKNKKKDNGYEVIAKKLYGFLDKGCSLEDVLSKLFEVNEKIQMQDIFLFSVLEVLSLIDARISVFELISEMDMVGKYLGKLLRNDYTVNVYDEFKQYGLQCIYPLQDDKNGVINDCDTIQDLMVQKCYNFKNYDIMYEIYDKMIPKYHNNEEIFKFMKKMVYDKEIDDSENNDKLVLLSIIISVFMKHDNLINKELLCFMKQCLDKNILSLDVMDKWRLDELDTITFGKPKSLIILCNLLFELEQRDIKENEDVTSSASDNEEDDDQHEDDIGGYISTYNLLQSNDNRNIANRCPWKC